MSVRPAEADEGNQQIYSGGEDENAKHIEKMTTAAVQCAELYWGHGSPEGSRDGHWADTFTYGIHVGYSEVIWRNNWSICAMLNGVSLPSSEARSYIRTSMPGSRPLCVWIIS